MGESRGEKAIRLQDVSDKDEFWDKFATVMGSEDGLVTYRYLGCRQDPVALEGYMDVRYDMRYPSGGLMAAPLSIAMAEGRGDDTAVPAPVMSSIHLVDQGRDVQRVLSYPADGPSRNGRTIQFGAGGMVVDANDRNRTIAFTQGMGVVMGPAPEGYEYVPPAPSGVVDSPDLPPLHEAFGGHRNEDGKWALPPLSLQIASTSGTLHHGATQVILERAAYELAAEAAGTDRLEIEDWTVFYTAPGLDGPFVAEGAVVGTNPGPDRYAARVHLVDAGHGNRLVAIATALYRPAIG